MRVKVQNKRHHADKEYNSVGTAFEIEESTT